MMIKMIAVCGSGVFVLLFVLSIAINKRRIKHATLRTREAMVQIEELLNQKNELLISAREEFDNDDDVLNGVELVSNSVHDNFDYNESLQMYYSSLNKIITSEQYAKKLEKNEKFAKILVSLKNKEEEILGTINYYNDKALEFNDFISRFSIKIAAFFGGYKSLRYFNTKKEEIEISNEVIGSVRVDLC